MNIWEVTEPPRSYILFSGIAMMGAGLGRRVYFVNDPHITYPLVNLLLIGPSGIGKSTSLRDMAYKRLLAPLPEDMKPYLISGKITKEALHEDLYVCPHSIIMASELANMFSKEKYQEGMIPYITDLLDLEPASIRTKGGGPAKVIRAPECCIVGGSTKEWLQDQLPTTAGEGGFLPRFLIIKEDHKYRRIPLASQMLTTRQQLELEKERERVCGIFRALLNMHRGPVTFADYAASDEYSIWYQSYTPESGLLSPFAARAGAHVLRLALLVAISCERVEITAADVRAGIALVDYALGRLQSVVVPMTPQGRLIARVLEAIGGEAVSDVAIKRAMRNYCGGQDVDKILMGLLQAKDVVIIDGKYRRAS